MERTNWHRMFGLLLTDFFTACMLYASGIRRIRCKTSGETT